MKYVHTTLQNCQKIIQCIALESESSEESSVLLIFPNHAQFVQFVKNGSQIIIKPPEMYPFGDEIRFVVPIGSHLAVITASNFLIMLESKPPFKRVFMAMQLSSGSSPLKSPIAHYAASASGENLVLCGYSNQVVVAAFDSEDNPTLTYLTLPDGIIVHSVAATNSPDKFILLTTALNSKKKFLLQINVTKQKVSKKVIEVDQSAFKMITFFNQENYGFQYLFTQDKLILNIADENPREYKLDSPVASYFSTVVGELCIQLMNGDIYVLDPRQESPPGSHGKLPLLTHFCALENDLLLCVAEHGDPFIIPVIHSYGLSSSSLSFEMFPAKHFNYTPPITDAAFVGSKLVLTCGTGSSSSVITMQNSIQYTKQEIDIDTTVYRRANGHEECVSSPHINSNLKLFTIRDGVFLSSKSTSMLLTEHLNIKLSSTLATGIFCNESVQVYDHGIYCLDSGNEWFSETVITAASISDELIIVYDLKDTLTLFGNGLNIVASCTIPAVTCLAFCDDVIAVATDREKGTSLVTMYSHDLSPTNDVIQLMSSVSTMLYQDEIGSLFIATTDGTVRKYTLDSTNFAQTYQAILVGSFPASLLPFKNSALIISDNVYLFAEDELLLLRVDSPICSFGYVIDDPDSLAYFGKDEKLYKLTIADSSDDLNKMPTSFELMPRHIFVDGQLAFILCRSGMKNQSQSSIVVTDYGNNQAQISYAFEPGIELTTIQPFDNGSLIVFYNDYNQEEPTWVIQLMKINNGQFELLDMTRNKGYFSPRTATLSDDGAILAPFRSSTIMSIPKDLKESQTDVRNYYRNLPPNISVIASRKNILWVASYSDNVRAIVVLKDEKKVCHVVDPIPRQVNSLIVLDDTSVAVGDRFGVISILRLPDDVAIEKPWRYVNINEMKLIRLERVASFSVGQTITSLMLSPNPNQPTIFYTTLLGQIGALIPISNEEDFNKLASVETQTEKACSGEFGLIHPKTVDSGRMAVLNGDMISMLRLLATDSQERIETGLKVHKEWVMGVICRLKTSAKF